MARTGRRVTRGGARAGGRTTLGGARRGAPRRRGRAATSRQTDRRQDIFDAAALLMRQRGFVGTTIEEVAQQLAVTKAALYYYVENKEELLYQILSQTLVSADEKIRAIERSKATPAEKMRQVIDTFVRLVAERPEFFTVYFQEKGHLAKDHLRSITKKEREIVDAVQRIYRQGVSTRAFRRLDPTAASFGLLGLCFWVYQWYRPTGRLAVSEVVRTFQELAERGYLERR